MVRRQGLATLCLLAALNLIAPPVRAEPWSFAVTGDGRTDPLHSPDPTGINTPVLRKLLHEFAAKKPRFVLYTGDLVVGENFLTHSTIETQFNNWQNIVKAEAPNLLILPVRGNHETKGDADGKIWLKMFKPMLDTNHVTYFPGEEGFSYSYAAPDHPEVVIIAADQFMPQRIHRVNLTQLDQALQQARSRKATHTFVFAHEMAFTSGSHGDQENMAAFPRQRDEFVDLLVSYGCEYFFAGHDHNYDWMLIKHPKWPEGRVLNQIVAGTAGAPFYPDKKYWGDSHGYDLTRREHRQTTYGYMWVTVDDAAATNKVSCTFVPVMP